MGYWGRGQAQEGAVSRLEACAKGHRHRTQRCFWTPPPAADERTLRGLSLSPGQAEPNGTTRLKEAQADRGERTRFHGLPRRTVQATGSWRPRKRGKRADGSTRRRHGMGKGPSWLFPRAAYVGRNQGRSLEVRGDSRLRALALRAVVRKAVGQHLSFRFSPWFWISFPDVALGTDRGPDVSSSPPVVKCIHWRLSLAHDAWEAINSHL